jgi:hypothetical protein
MAKKTENNRYIPVQWKQEIIMKQRSYCASPNCAKLHNGKKMKVNMNANFDHIRPLAMNGKNTKSNIQALCPGCHAVKTREDRDRIKRWIERYGSKLKEGAEEKRSQPSKPSRTEWVFVYDMYGIKRNVPKKDTKIITGLDGRKRRVLKKEFFLKI